MRLYSTSQLESGQVWRDYKIVVKVERDGQTITREKVIDLQAGDTQEIDFEFESTTDPARLASARK